VIRKDKDKHDGEEEKADDADGQKKKEEITLLKWIELEVFYEYEKAMKCIFTDQVTFIPVRLNKTDITANKNTYAEAEFHPLYLAAIFNQQVFLH